MLLVLKIIGGVIALCAAVSSFAAKKILTAVKKREPDENEILKFKSVMLLIVLVLAAALIVPDYIRSR